MRAQEKSSNERIELLLRSPDSQTALLVAPGSFASLGGK